MKTSKVILIVLLFAVFLAGVACGRRSTPPAPDMAAGVYINAGYEYYTWAEGLSLLMWHDATQSSMCDSSGSTSDPEHNVTCSAVSSQGQRVEWQIKTGDGIQARLSIDGTSFDLKDGNVFLITVTGESTEIQQIQRDLADVTDEDLIDFSLDDPVIGPFIQARD